LSVDSPLFILMADPRVRILLDRDVPQLDVKRNPKASLRQLQHMGLAITDEKLQQIDEQLKQIPPARDNH
jgi:hypothetical protein